MVYRENNFQPTGELLTAVLQINTGENLERETSEHVYSIKVPNNTFMIRNHNLTTS